MDFRQIQYFMKVYEERSFSKAAEKANVVQPALSMQIRRLEEELQAILFDRSPRGIEPTAAGRRFYDLCLPIAKGVAEARQEMIEFSEGSRIAGSIHVGLPPSVNRGVMGRVLSTYIERFPNVEVTVTEAYSDRLTQLVQQGVLDLALGARPLEHSGLVYRAAYQDKLLLVAGEPINGVSLTPCRLNDLDGLKLILPSRQNLLGSTIANFIDSGQITPRRVINVDGLVATLEMARLGDWAGIFPVISLIREIENGELYIYPIYAPVMSFELYFVNDPQRPPSGALRAFTEVLQAELQSVDAVRSRLFPRMGP